MTVDTVVRTGLYQPSQRIRGTPEHAPTPSGRIPRWHCIATNYGQDHLAQATISADGWQVYRPLHASRVRIRLGVIEALFPGYLFASWAADDDWPRICRQRGVYRILGRPGYPQAIREGVIEDLIARTSERGVVDDPGANAAVVPLRKGQSAQVIEGPMKGWEGVCTLARGDRISLLLAMFGRPQTIEFSARAVAPL